MKPVSHLVLFMMFLEIPKRWYITGQKHHQVVQPCPLSSILLFPLGLWGEGEADERFTVAGRKKIYFSSMTAHIFLYALPSLCSKLSYFELIKIW